MKTNINKISVSHKIKSQNSQKINIFKPCWFTTYHDDCIVLNCIVIVSVVEEERISSMSSLFLSSSSIPSSKFADYF